MAKCSRDTHPKLFAYLDAYGLDPRIIEKIDRIKGNASTGYYVLGYPSDGEIALLDLSNTPDRMAAPEVTELGWNMLNDGISPDISEKDWNKMKIAPYLEHFTIPGHEIYGEE